MYFLFGGREKCLLGMDFHVDNFCVEGNFRGEPSRGNFTMGIFDKTLIRNSFYLSYFVFAYSLLHL